ncbi:MAG TPA: hypothetical protein VGE72_26625 [Azospirillum sp.]
MPETKSPHPTTDVRALMEQAHRERSACMDDLFARCFRGLLAFCVTLLTPPRRHARVVRLVAVSGRPHLRSR